MGTKKEKDGQNGSGKTGSRSKVTSDKVAKPEQGPRKDLEERFTLSSVNSLFDGILDGNTADLGRAITLIESHRDADSRKADLIIEKCLAQKTDGIRVGITGVPGVGKSTFIESLGKLLTDKGHRVAVLAVDPSSTKSKGSIMGDKTRMEGLVKNPYAFIRPSPSGSSLGGVARKTRESAILCEAAGYDIVLIETVGVGQSETTVHGMVDFFLLLKLSGAGDELQGIKRGIVEMADAVAINKADGENRKAAQAAAQEFRGALHLYPPKENGWSPRVLTCSALESEGIVAIWEMVTEYIQSNKTSGHFRQKRQRQNRDWLYEAIEQRLKSDFFQNEAIAAAIEESLPRVLAGTASPFRAAAELIGRFKNKS